MSDYLSYGLLGLAVLLSLPVILPNFLERDQQPISMNTESSGTESYAQPQLSIQDEDNLDLVDLKMEVCDETV